MSMKGRGGASTLVVVLIVLSSCLVISSEFTPRFDESFTTENESTKSSSIIYDSPVRIFSDNDFVLQNWPGNGTPESPYVISGLSFSHTEWSPVVIENTRAYFILSDCVLVPLFEDPPSSGVAISISNVANCVIENITIYDKSCVVALHKVNDSIIRNNRISSSHCSIFVEQSYNCEITNNSIFYTDRGIELHHTVNSNITRNTIVECREGITLISESNNNVITKNRVGWCDYSYARDYCTGNNWTGNSWSNWDGEESYLIQGRGLLILDHSPSHFIDDLRGPTFEFRRYYPLLINRVAFRSPFTFQVNVSDDSGVASVLILIREYHWVNEEWVWNGYELNHSPISGNSNRFTYTYNITGPFIARYLFWANDTLGNSRRSEYDYVSITNSTYTPNELQIFRGMIVFFILVIGVPSIAYVIWQKNRKEF
ncbi:MAG: NosD domain-containing protein [Candidatus Thorarchaeota archaeon]